MTAESGTAVPVPEVPPPARRRVRWSLAVGLLFLSPVCAEYLVGYDTSTGDPVALLGGLLILGPLYGGPALLIREFARRLGVRWPGIVALALAVGVLQAGVIDQSLFSESYREIADWDENIAPTWVPALGLSGTNTVTFLAGHAVWSFCVPIALVESLSPAQSRRPWLRWPGLAATALLYAAAALLIWSGHQNTESDHASTAQIVGCLVVVALLALLAVTAGRRTPAARDHAVPPPLVVGVVSLAAAVGANFVPNSWLGVGISLTLYTVVAVIVEYLSRSNRWHPRHIVALAAGPLLANAAVGFLVTPLGGEVPLLAKYAHNTTLLVGAALLCLWAARRNRPRPEAAA